MSQINIDQDDIKINYNTWCANSIILGDVESGTKWFGRRGLQSNVTIDCNHYYYHSHSNMFWDSHLILDYNIELYRQLLNYPKLYNIDYDYVEKEYKYDSALLLNFLHNRPRSVIVPDIVKKNPQKDLYYNLKEFYGDYIRRDVDVIDYMFETSDNVARCIDRINIQDYDLFDCTESISDDELRLIANTDRMYNVQLNPMIKKWYKNGKYMLYAILPHNDTRENSLSIDFCHFQIYYNRLKLLQSLYNDDKKDLKHLSQYTWIAFNDCSRYCKDELYRQKTFSLRHDQRGPKKFSDLFKKLFARDDKATWDRLNKHRYSTRPQR